MKLLLICCQKTWEKLGQSSFLTKNFYKFADILFLDLQNLKIFQRCSVKKVFLKISHNSQENTLVRVSILIKLLTSASNFIKNETPAHVFFCVFCKIIKNTFFIELLGWLLMPSDFHLITRGKKSQVFSIIFSIFFSEMGSKPCKTPKMGLFFKKNFA